MDNQNKSTSTLLQRRVSFTSVGMLAGCMPENVGLDDTTVTVIFTFDKPPRLDDVVSDVRTLFQNHRLSTVPKGEYRSTKWVFEDVGDIDPARMVRVLNITCDTKEEWAEIVQKQRNITLRKEDLPWWEFVLMINKGKEDHLLLFRFDHALGDGLAFAGVLTKILKQTDGSEISSMIPKSMLSNKAKAKGKLLQTLLKLPKAIFDVIVSPLGRPDDPTTFSKYIVGNSVVDNRHRKLIVFDQVPLDSIKKIKDAARVSLNDVLLAAIAHAIDEYCRLHDCPIIKEKGENLLFRLLMPVGFPHKITHPADSLRNKWVSVSIRLPVGTRDIMQKLIKINETTTNLKSSPLAPLTLAIQNTIFPLLPLSISRKTIYDIHSKHSLTCSNVPGPSETVLISGTSIKSCMFYTNHLHPVLSMISYNGQINTTLVIDDDAVSNPELLRSFFMKSVTLMSEALKLD